MTRLKYSGTTYRSAAAMQGFFVCFFLKFRTKRKACPNLILQAYTLISDHPWINLFKQSSTNSHIPPTALEKEDSISNKVLSTGQRKRNHLLTMYLYLKEECYSFLVSYSTSPYGCF